MGFYVCLQGSRRRTSTNAYAGVVTECAPPHVVLFDTTSVSRLRAALVRGSESGTEPCGYLLGVREGSCFRVLGVREGANVHPRPERAFRLAADEHLAVRREAAHARLALIGIWHGHRRGGAEPSAADLAGMAPEHAVLARRMPALMLIASGQPADELKLAAYVREGPSRWVRAELRS